uniref:Uncharacterized protein AlNc14C33G3010 n=1 Tax=Albugo laibachii Nc14 TaxID=890382 RepID=F0W8B6_9STRA|nr:conserved hypothetical protein [Albugo laibachii Nc14]|eukprot:CCA17316.1 conserved hypothetical protein [Albugo laibachii Nc14]
MASDQKSKSTEVFQQLKNAIEKDGPALARKIKGTFLFKITSGQSWFLDLKSDKPSLRQADEKADVTITVSDDDFVSLATGKLNAQKAYMLGKIKVKGSVLLASKISTVFNAVQGRSKL